MRKELAQKYIRGRGIEIGGLANPLEIPVGAKVTYVDCLPPELAHTDVALASKVKNVVIDNAEELFKFQPNSLDFIIANHVVEHCHDPIGTLKLWSDVLRVDGVIYAAVPEKTKTFDAPRTVTKLEHLIEDHTHGWRNTLDEHHYREWLSIIDKMQEPTLTEVVNYSVKHRTNIHFHVWDASAMRELLDYVIKTTNLQLVEFAINGSEVIWVLRKV